MKNICYGLGLVLILTACNYPGRQRPDPVQELPASIFGLETQSLTLEGGLEEVRLLAPAWLRRNGVLWSEVEPAEGARNWAALSKLEEELIKADSMGAEVILILRQTPAWAQQLSGVPCGPVRRDRLDALAAFTQDMVTRYSQPPFNVKIWELWNEPDVSPTAVKPDGPFGCWGDPTDEYYGGGHYAEMLKAVYPAIKAADPQAVVLVGGLLLDCDPRQPPPAAQGSPDPKDCSAARFLEGILEAGGGPFFDGVSFHAYDFYLGENGRYANPNWHSDGSTSGPVLKAKAGFLQEMLGRYQAADKLLLNTEGALLCGAKGDEAPCQAPEFEETKAAYVVQSFAAALETGLQANVWYSLKGWRASGLVDPNLVARPAFQAYLFASLVLREARFVSALEQYPGIQGAGFRRGETDIWLLWSRDGGVHPVSLPVFPTRIHDSFGAQLPSAQELDVGPLPVYVFWENPEP